MTQGIRLRVAYDGRAFAGFQRQRDQRTVQGVLCDAVSRIEGQPMLVRGASRTDSGVHAIGQVVAFASERPVDLERWPGAINRLLPTDVSVRQAEACAVDYDPRFDATDKTYRYLFRLNEHRDPLWYGRVWELGRFLHKGHVLDLDAMRAACVELQGTHDYRVFRAAGDTRDSTVRTLMRVALEAGYAGDPALVAFEVQGNAFMLNMVRILAGTLIEVGRGRMSPADVAALVAGQGTRADAGETAPPHGLTLVSISLGRTELERALEAARSSGSS